MWQRNGHFVSVSLLTRFVLMLICFPLTVGLVVTVEGITSCSLFSDLFLPDMAATKQLSSDCKGSIICIHSMIKE